MTAWTTSVFLGVTITYTCINFFLTLSNLAQLVKALEKVKDFKSQVFHRKGRVFADRSIAESMNSHKIPVELHFMTEEK